MADQVSLLEFLPHVLNTTKKIIGAFCDKFISKLRISCVSCEPLVLENQPPNIQPAIGVNSFSWKNLWTELLEKMIKFFYYKFYCNGWKGNQSLSEQYEAVTKF